MPSMVSWALFGWLMGGIVDVWRAAIVLLELRTLLRFRTHRRR